MKEQINKVKEFHKAFKIEGQDPKLRYKLMMEENDEYLEASTTNDKVAIADALGDMLYVLVGTILTHGLENVIEDVFKEIHTSNMSKLDNNGEPLINGVNFPYDDRKAYGKVLKSNNFKEPDLDWVNRGYKRYCKIE